MQFGLFLGVALAMGIGPTATSPDRLDVPFVAQTPLLCGGAVAAMVERFWGARGRDADDYESLVRPAEGGIRTADLTSEMRRNGYRATSTTGDPATVTHALADGVPPIVLLGRDHGAFHYVVVTGLTPAAAIVHDPNFGPHRTIDLADFLNAWADSNYWTLEVRPAITTHPERRGNQDSVESTTVSSHPTAVDSAMVELREGRYREAAEIARSVTRGPESHRALGHRLLATALYMDGDAIGALDAWNEAGEPDVDHIQIQGLLHTRYHVAGSQLTTSPGKTLSARDLRLSERRLKALPSIQSGRVTYRPNPDGTAQVTASLFERSRWPTRLSVLHGMTQGLAAQRTSVSMGPFIAAADVWTVAAGWSTAQRGVHGSMKTAVTGVPGVVSVDFGLTQEQHLSPDGSRPVAERRLAGGLRFSQWATASVRLSGALGLERWSTDQSSSTRMAHLGAEALFAASDEGRWILLGVDGWGGAGSIVKRTVLNGGIQFHTSSRSTLRVRAGAVSASLGASRTLWPGAGTGRVRGNLLRAHPLDMNGTFSGAAFGTRMANATAEFRTFERFGPAKLGAVAFVDAVTVRPEGPGSTSLHLIDYGAGAFVDMGSREITLSLARGRPGWVLSLRADRWAPEF